MIDHHLFPADFVDFAISRPEVCSTAQLIYEWMEEAAILPELDAVSAAPMYLGLVTDTGSFRFSSVTPKTHEILAHLLELGIDHSAIHEQTFDNNRVDKIRLRAYILAERLEIVEAYRVAIISVTQKELSRFHHVKGDTEGLVNQALSLEGIDVAAFFMEKEEGVKISFRSKSHVAVNMLAMDHFLGGGHKNAAGGASDENMESTISRFKSLLPEYYG
jgi:phosphoesterase RecJ-like protein